MTRLVDLSQDIYEGMQVYPGHLKTVTFQHATHEETAVRFEGGFSFQTWGFMLNDNGPTHVDSFSHLDPEPNAATIDLMPLELFYGAAICLDVSAVPERTDITAEHLDDALEQTGLTLERGRQRCQRGGGEQSQVAGQKGPCNEERLHHHQQPEGGPVGVDQLVALAVEQLADPEADCGHQGPTGPGQWRLTRCPPRRAKPPSVLSPTPGQREARLGRLAPLPVPGAGSNAHSPLRRASGSGAGSR
jgi:Putative cyclase